MDENLGLDNKDVWRAEVGEKGGRGDGRRAPPPSL